MLLLERIRDWIVTHIAGFAAGASLVYLGFRIGTTIDPYTVRVHTGGDGWWLMAKAAQITIVIGALVYAATFVTGLVGLWRLKLHWTLGWISTIVVFTYLFSMIAVTSTLLAYFVLFPEIARQ